MEIKLDDLSGNEVAELIKQHLQGMALNSPPESIHALNLEQLRRPEITFWSAWEGKELAGIGALKELDGQHGEIKSMRTSPIHLRKGVAKRLLQHILEEAKRRGYRRLSLETGSMEAFEPAKRL
jgi:putative acetyltransferase